MGRPTHKKRTHVVEKSLELSDSEIKFARKLSSNDKSVRDAVLRKLRQWISLKSEKENGISPDEFLNLWKGLFYCLWNQDKMLLQEELSDRISSLITSTIHPSCYTNFITTFFITISREWSKIDVFRMDKFMMLVRLMFRKSLDRCLVESGTLPLLCQLSETLMLQPATSMASSGTVMIPLGLVMHVLDMYIEEMERVGAGGALSNDQCSKLLEPVIQLIAADKRPALLERAESRVFDEMIMRSKLGQETELELGGGDDGDDDDGEKKYLEINYSALSERLFSVASQQKCRSRNREILYRLVKKFKDLSQGTYPLVDYMSSGSDLDEEDVEKSVAMMTKLAEKNMKMRRKKMMKKMKKGKMNSKDEMGDGDDDEMGDSEDEMDGGYEIGGGDDEELGGDDEDDFDDEMGDDDGELSGDVEEDFDDEEDSLDDDDEMGDVDLLDYEDEIGQDDDEFCDADELDDDEEDEMIDEDELSDEIGEEDEINGEPSVRGDKVGGGGDRGKGRGDKVGATGDNVGTRRDKAECRGDRVRGKRDKVGGKEHKEKKKNRTSSEVVENDDDDDVVISIKNSERPSSKSFISFQSAASSSSSSSSLAQKNIATFFRKAVSKTKTSNTKKKKKKPVESVTSGVSETHHGRVEKKKEKKRKSVSFALNMNETLLF